MKLMDIYLHLKPDLEYVETWLDKEVRSKQKDLENAAIHLLKAGGKRIRPVFVLLSGQFGQYDREKLARVAVALELIHMATLVHDDVIDDSKTRRGIPTVRSEWGNRMAMYTGDFIFARALSMLSELPYVQIHQLLSKSIVRMCEGEIEQIRDFYSLEQNFRRYLRRIERKTAILMEVSCKLGAIVTDASQSVVRTLGRYGHFLGMAFQIVDDILDFTSTQDKLGKPAGADLLQGNITLPVLYALHCTQSGQALRETVRPNMSRTEADQAIRLVKESGGIEYAKKVAGLYLDKCLNELAKLPAGQHRDSLEQIAKFTASREY
ncbi:polyprenyl synthetase family protein [Effusibacillus lacus]|uniref:Heptaprenyl diphosphate synthase component II n=1 Tax=Effusibacillus lacus TaxID=1348429 RepID=A0A292YKM8_9BACL|nr:polyprenyl synthetase family protein [Effusibacillus lacus]TCS75288.1 heptaprenyl diphosphate synthase [Effusibacillus lacus]GAX89726.1 heptaprenyl diphosphate synthase component II [Effusibacillus lacus]